MNPLSDRETAEAALFCDIAAAIAAFACDDETFDALARRLFAYQFVFNAPYRRFCEGRGVTPESVVGWRDIPAAPAAAFKHHALSCAPVEDCAPERGGRVFHSSGTTQTETSRHYLNATALNLYRLSLKASYERFVPRTTGIMSLVPLAEEAPNSSLSFMLDTLTNFFINQPHRTVEQNRELTAGWFRIQRKDYTVFGTAFAFVNFFDATDERFQLPEDCVIVETGGFKGRSREVSRDELYALFTERLGVPPERCLSEYGMSEMASQFYDSTAIDAANGIVRLARKVGPPWLKTRVMDPLTGTDAAPGQPGLLAHYDLANLNSVFAIQTEDYGITAEDGEGFALLGRAPGAVLRGCSLLAE